VKSARQTLGSSPSDGHFDSVSFADLVIPLPILTSPFLFLPILHLLVEGMTDHLGRMPLPLSPGQAPPFPTAMPISSHWTQGLLHLHPSPKLKLNRGSSLNSKSKPKQPHVLFRASYAVPNMLGALSQLTITVTL
jgi:hypothetical protein